MLNATLLLRRVFVFRDLDKDSIMKEKLLELSKEELVDLLELSSKNIVAMDGVWFQTLEEAIGMDKAMGYDAEAWRRYSPAEARRLKKYYHMEEHPGLKGLEKALIVGYSTLANQTSVVWEDDSLIYRVDVCRVQAARSRKGMEFHPCKRVGLIEYQGFARAIDDRIECECVSCYPDITDDTCSCAWKFTINQ